MKNYEKELMFDLIEKYCESHDCQQCCFYRGCDQCGIDEEMLKKEIEIFYKNP